MNHEHIFRYNVTLPTIEQLKKRNRVDILVDRVKKLKRDQFKQDYSDYSLVGQTPVTTTLVNRLKDHYHSHGGTLFHFSSSSSSADEEEEEEPEEKKRFFKRSITTTSGSIHNNSRRHKLMSSLSHKKKKKQLLQKEEEKRKQEDERIQIRHKMINFVIPADWTSCIDNTTKSRDIFLSHQVLQDVIQSLHDQQLNIEYEMNRITTHQLMIQEYKQKLLKLNHSIHTLPPLVPANIQRDNQLYKLLKQAYRQHLRLVKKMDRFKYGINTSLRLDNLQLKIEQSQHGKSTFRLLMPWCAFMLFYFFYYAFYSL